MTFHFHCALSLFIFHCALKTTTCPERNNSSLDQLRERVEQINKAQFVQNFEGHEITDDTIIVVVQVHNRVAYLREVIDSLRFVKGIESTVLVFSHDYFSDEINEAVLAIDFAPVMQIFFPFNTQLYPNEFPGTDPRDCPPTIDVKTARRSRCLGAETPDSYSHFRNGNITQTKHHWWWKTNQVFDHLHITKYFDGFVLFLEEDHYVAPDILHTLRLMIGLANRVYRQCNRFGLGHNGKRQSCEANAGKVEIANENSLGFAFNRSLWNSLSTCASVFCTFDDYNWDWSLLHTAEECFFQRMTSLVLSCSRVFHIGDCGMHHKKGDCDSNDSLQLAKHYMHSVKPFLFPKTLTLKSKRIIELPRPFGGWSDPRDVDMCISMGSQLNFVTNG